jgi:gas vesicle protein
MILRNGRLATERYPAACYPAWQYLTALYPSDLYGEAWDSIKAWVKDKWAETGKESDSVFVKELTGQREEGGETTFASVMGALVRGIVVDFLGGTAEAIGDIAVRPDKAIEGLATLVTERDTVLPAIWDTTKTWFKEQIVEGSPEDWAAAGGQIVGEITTCFIAPVKAATAGAKAVKLTGDGAKLIAHADDAAKAAKAVSGAAKATAAKLADDAAGAAKKIAGTAKTAKSSDIATQMKDALPDIRTSIENFRNRLNEMQGFKPALADGDVPGSGYRFDMIKPEPPSGGGVHIKGAKAEESSNIQNTITRTTAEFDDLAKDPARGGKVDSKSIAEREVGIGLEAQGKVGKLMRDPSGSAEFIDTVSAQKWDVKSFNSKFAPKGYNLSDAMSNIRKSISLGENVMPDTRNLNQSDLAELIDEVNRQGLNNNVLLWP